MDGAIIPFNAWIVVADAHKALFLRNAGNASSLMLEVQDSLEAEDNDATHAQGTERPGRTATGSRRSGYEQRDFHAENERQFLVRVARRLEQVVASHEIQRVVLVAPPKALACLRTELPETVKKYIAAEHDRDLVNLPLTEIEKLLSS